MVSTGGSAEVRRRRQFDKVPSGSASSKQTLWPASMAATASPMASVLLPVPPLRETKAIVCTARLPVARVAKVRDYAKRQTQRHKARSSNRSSGCEEALAISEQCLGAVRPSETACGRHVTSVSAKRSRRPRRSPRTPSSPPVPRIYDAQSVRKKAKGRPEKSSRGAFSIRHLFRRPWIFFGGSVA